MYYALQRFAGGVEWDYCCDLEMHRCSLPWRRARLPAATAVARRWSQPTESEEAPDILRVKLIIRRYAGLFLCLFDPRRKSRASRCITWWLCFIYLLLDRGKSVTHSTSQHLRIFAIVIYALSPVVPLSYRSDQAAVHLTESPGLRALLNGIRIAPWHGVAFSSASE